MKFTFDRLRAQDSGYSYGSQVETISEVDVVDPLTVQFKLSQADRAVPHLHGLPRLLDRAEEAGRMRAMTSTPSRSAAARSSSSATSRARWSSSSATKHYYEAGKPYFDAMEFHLIADVTALTNAVMSGKVNFSNEIPPKDWATVTANPGLVGADARGLALLLAAAEQHQGAARQSEGAPGHRPRDRPRGASSPAPSSARRRRFSAA